MARIQAGITISLSISRWTQGQLTYIFPLGFPLCTRKNSGIHRTKDPRNLGSDLLEYEELLL